MQLYSRSAIFLIFVALAPHVVSAQGIFDWINPFWWIYNYIVQLLVPESFTCGEIETALENAIGRGDIISCTCTNVANVVILFPVGATAKATCEVADGLEIKGTSSESTKLAPCASLHSSGPSNPPILRSFGWIVQYCCASRNWRCDWFCLGWRVPWTHH